MHQKDTYLPIYIQPNLIERKLLPRQKERIGLSTTNNM